MREVEDEKSCGVEEMGWDGVGEVVVGESESAERVEEAEFGGEVAGEGLVREEKGGDAVASANNAGPVAWGWVGVGPGVEDVSRVGVYGGFES